MLFVLVVSLLVATSFADSGDNSTHQCPENQPPREKTSLLSRLYRTNVLRSPLQRFKVVSGRAPGPPPYQYRPPQDFHALREKCLKDGELFEDPEFDAVESSLYYNASSADDYDGIKWLRPHDIVKEPKFIVNGTSRFDIKQGSEGDCWFMAVLANVASNDAIISQNVPKDQDFVEKYCGIFHFRFHQMGYWVDIVVDDRLPTRHGDLFFSESSQGDEFWGALLEKAYAKLYGSYEALSGGYEYEAMEDLTGGVAVQFDLNELLPVPDLFEIIKISLAKQSIVTAEIEKEVKSEADKILKKGLGNNHAYSITALRSVEVTKPTKKEKVPLLRIRNPWGQREWTGPWRDSAREWDFVSEEDKKDLGLKKANDGEYWMTYKDFLQTFDGLTICLIDPDMLPTAQAVDTKKVHWEVSVFLGEWVRGKTAGGCDLDTLHENPQYQITLQPAENDGKLLNMFVGLMQESQRALRNFVKQEEDYLRVGFVIYKLENSTWIGQNLTSEYIHANKYFGTSLTYGTWRDVTRLFFAPAGVYTIIPCTFHSGVEGEFIVRVVTEKANNLVEL